MDDGSSPENTPVTRPSSSAGPVTGEKFGKFLRTDRLGAGGMGEVWKAWDSELSRWVALKFLKGSDEEEVARFKREAVIAGKLSHPNIGAIYEVGEAAGRHYIAMQFVDGRTLRGFKGTAEEAAAIVRDAARAVHAAHERDIVHRDLKPDNIMRDRAGRVFVMDFGLARPAEGASGLSISGTVVGTPSYMPPEQAAGKRVDARADVYSLGATLYEMVTGAVPFRGDSVLDTLRKLAEEDAVLPRRLRPGLDLDLETIVMKCLEKEPARRYESAAALADDLARWIEGEPILAHPASAFYRLRKKLVKRKAVVVALVLGIVAVSTAIGVLAPALIRERAATARAQRVASLWGRVSAMLSEAEQSARVGELGRASAKCDEGVAACANDLDLAETHYFLARLHRVAGRRDEAAREVERAIALDPAFGEATFERGLMRVEDYRAMLFRFYQSGWAAISAGQSKEQRIAKRLEAAVPKLRETREAAMADLGVKVGKSAFFREVDALYGRAELEYLGGDAARGVVLLQEVVAADPLNVRAWTTLAMDAVEEGRLKDGVDLATKAIERHRGFADAYFIRAFAYASNLHDSDDPVTRKRSMELGLKDADTAIAYGCESAMVWAIRGQMKLESGDADGAFADESEAIRRNPEYVTALLLRGKARQMKGDHPGAIEDYSKAGAIDARSTQALVLRGDAHQKLGDHEACLKDATAVLKLDANHYVAWGMRGEANRALKRYAEALEDFGRAAKLRPAKAEPRANRAGVYQDLGRFDDAVAEATLAIEAEAGAHHGWFQRGMANGQWGRLDEALRDLEEALKREPRLAQAWDGVGNCFAGKGDLERALRAYNESLKINPKGITALMNRATVHVMRKDWAAAERDYGSVLAIEPANLGAMVRRADVRLKRGDRTGAIADFEEALRMAPASWPSRATVEALLKKAKE